MKINQITNHPVGRLFSSDVELINSLSKTFESVNETKKVFDLSNKTEKLLVFLKNKVVLHQRSLKETLFYNHIELCAFTG